MVDNNDALMREVDEELRREQIAKLWDRYGTYALGAAMLLVAVVGGFKFWEARQQVRAEAGGAEYNDAMHLTAAGKADEAAKKLDSLVASGHGGYAALAELQQAGALLKAGRPLDAFTLFEKLSKDGSADPMLRNFATIQAATLRLGEADFTEMQNRLNALNAEGGAWRHNARELLGLSAMKTGRMDDARSALGSLLGDRETPQGALERARVMLGSIAASELAKTGMSMAPAPAAAGAAPAKDGGTADTGAHKQPK